MAGVLAALSSVFATSATLTALGTTIATATFTQLAIATLAGIAASSIVASVLIDAPSASSFNATASNVLLNKKSNNAPIPAVYGTRRVGGIIVFMATHGGYQPFHNQQNEDNTKFLSLFLIVSEGEIEGCGHFWINGELSTEEKFIDDIWIKQRHGTDEQVGFDELVNVLDIQDITYSSDTHRLAGTAYLWVEIFSNFKVFPQGIPTINALVKGVKIYDPRTMTTQWSENPVLCVRDYLTNARYGRAIDSSLIDDTSFILAANYCDEEVAYNGVDLVKRYTCNGVIDTQNSSLDIIKQLLSSCRGILTFSGGLYKVIIDKPEIADFTFSEDNIIGGWNIKLGDKNTQFNRIRTNFFNANKDYQPDITTVESTELREQDGGLLEITTNLPCTSNIVLAKAISTINLNQSRQTITCEFTSTIEGLRIEVGDVVYINHKTPGWDTHNSGLGKKFRIMRVTLQNNDEVRILAKEYADEVYDLDVQDFEELPSIIKIDDLSVCLPPTDLSYELFNVVSSIFLVVINKGVDVTWNVSPDTFVVGYEVGFKQTNSSNWGQTDVGNGLLWSTTVFFPSESRIRIRAYNTIGVRSKWVE